MNTRKKIVLFHYHLRKCGVTTVIRNQAEILKDSHDILIITGETPEEFIHDNLIVLPEMGYTRPKSPDMRPEKSAQILLSAIRRFFGSDCDLIHFHNPTLAKNKNLVRIIKIISQAGIKVFMQIHDFSEDGRPKSYLKEDYPSGVHYGAINTRDCRFLLESGLQQNGLHYLPNYVRAVENTETDISSKHLFLYPVRAIRRKNIGEILLTSLYLNEQDYAGITLPALNPEDLKSYEDWKFFARKQGLKVEFDMGLKNSFSSVIEQAKCFLTTSITEGFGFAFLEPWIHNRYLIGRKIPEICADFVFQGIDLNHLYSTFLIPVNLIDRKYYLEKIEKELKSVEQSYGIRLDKSKFINYFKTMLDGEMIDFGMLSEKLQEEVILKIIGDNYHKRIVFNANKHLDSLTDTCFNHSVISRNKEIVLKNYSQENYKNRINQIYNQVLAIKPKQKIDKKALLDRFLSPEQFTLLKWGKYDR